VGLQDTPIMVKKLAVPLFIIDFSWLIPNSVHPVLISNPILEHGSLMTIKNEGGYTVEHEFPNASTLPSKRMSDPIERYTLELQGPISVLTVYYR